MVKVKNKKNKIFGPVSVLLILSVVVAILSCLLSVFGFEGYQTVIINGNLETKLITVNNLLSLDGIRFIIGNAVTNFRNLEPLVLIIISLLGISICEKSGFLAAVFSPLKRIKLSIIIFITLFLSVLASIIGDYSFIFLIPLIGVMYKYLGKNPVLGIITVFIGLTIGYGTGFIFNYNDYSLGNLTELSAIVSVDKNYAYSLFSDLYIMIFSSIALCIFGTILINKFLVHKLPKKYLYEEEELVISKEAKRVSVLVGLLVSAIFAFMIIPFKVPGAGLLLDKDATRYLDQLFGSNAPFNHGLVLVVTLIFITMGMVYGKISKNIKNSHEFSLGMSTTFENLEFMFVLLFFSAQLISIVEWTNIGMVIGARLTTFMSSMQFSGIPLIITLFIVVVLMSILMPGSIEKWNLLSPVVIPLFMRSNITPNLTQYIFKIADGLGKSITPLFIYYIIMLAFLEKYRISEKNQVSVFGVLKLIIPVALVLALIMLLIIILWYIIGLPIGIGTYSTL